MAKRMVMGKVVEVGHFPIALRQLGFESAEHVERVARRFGDLKNPMKLADVVEWFSGNK